MLKWINNKKGSIVILVAVGMVALLGFTSIAVDVGLMTSTKSKLQNACDAAALAGAQELPDNPSTAISVAEEYAKDNGVINPVVTLYDNDFKIRVEGEGDVKLLFARVLGRDNTKISAGATVVVGSTGTVYEGGGLRPFAVALRDSDGDGYPDEIPPDLYNVKDGDGNLVFRPDDDDDGNGVKDGEGEDIDYHGEPYVFETGYEILLRLESGNGDDTGYAGNYGLLALDDSGRDLEQQVIYGARTTYSLFDDVETKTGVNVGILDGPNGAFNDPDCPNPRDFTVPIVYSLQVHMNIQRDGDENIIYDENGDIVSYFEETVHGSDMVNIVGFAKIRVEEITEHKEIRGTFLEDSVAGSPSPIATSFGAYSMKLVE